MNRIKNRLLLLALGLLPLSLWAAPIGLDALSVRPTGLVMTPGGSLVAAVQADDAVCLIRSASQGEKWDKLQVLPNLSDAVLWRGFAGEVRLFATDAEGFLTMRVCRNLDEASPAWSAPEVLARGYCSAPPVLLRNGAILLPAYLSDSDGPGVLLSMDRGGRWFPRPGGVKLPEKVHSQRPDPILMPYRSGRLALFNRATGTQWRWQSVSTDFGQSWSAPAPWLYSPDTPLSLSLMPNGKWLAVKNGRLDQRIYYIPDRLFAYLSEDEGQSWYGDLVLDNRRDAISPCALAPGDGNIYILYAYQPIDGSCSEVWFVRTGEMEINAAVPTRTLEPSDRTRILTAEGCARQYAEAVKPYLSTKGKPSGAPLNVASYNIEYRNPKEGYPWEKRLEYVDAIFRKYEFDVVGVQEPFRPEYDDLAARLGDKWGSIFACTNLTQDDFSNSIFWRRERIEKLDDGIFWYTENPGRKGGFGGPTSRLCIWAKFRDKSSGNIFFLFNSHYDFVLYDAQMTSSRLLLRKIREIAGGCPVLCTGDYNALEDNPACQLLAEGPWLKDAMTAARKPVNPKTTSMGHYAARGKIPQNGKHIDHIYFTPGLSRVDTWEILCEEHAGMTAGSDHNPIKIQWQLLK